MSYVEFFNGFSAAAISNIESSRDGSASPSVMSDKKHRSSGYASLIAEINALDFSDDMTSVTSDRTGEDPALYCFPHDCGNSRTLAMEWPGSGNKPVISTTKPLI